LTDVPPLTTSTTNIATGNPVVPYNPPVTGATPPEDALPDDFDPFAHLCSVYIPQHNAAVNKFFSDLPTDWKPNIATARSSLRVACTMQVGENELMHSMRHRLFWDILGYSKTDLILYQGTPDAFAQPVTGHPRIYLVFTQDKSGVAVGGNPATMQLSFRIMQYTQATWTPALATTLATEIKTVMCPSGVPWLFTKGKNIYAYYDKPNGYRLKIFGNDQESSVLLIEALLQILGISYDNTKLSITVPQKNNPSTVSGQQLVYGREINLPLYRPVVNVRFRYAYAVCPGNPSNIVLYDTTGLRKALVK